MTGLVDCPTCAAPAEVSDRADWPSTDGPIPHARVYCVAGHIYYGPWERA